MRIVLTGGGSGGHFYPLIAVAEEINKINQEDTLLKAELFFVSDSPYDQKALFDNDITFKRVMAGKLRCYFSLRNITDACKTLWGIIDAIITIFKIYPDVVFSKGGYASLPIMIAAKIFGIPLFIHESDTVPGRANRWAAKFAKRIAISFKEAAIFFPPERTAWTGNPIRQVLQIKKENAHDILGLDPKTPTIFFLGGSLGANLINQRVLEMLFELVREYQVIHQTGRDNIKNVAEVVKIVLKEDERRNRYRCFDYLDGEVLQAASSAADIIISRAGSTIFEIAIWGKPSILIPITDSNGDHQRKNAHSYEKSGACVVIEESNFRPHIVLSEIRRILIDSSVKERMSAAARNFGRPDAARKIAREIINIALTHER